MMSHLKQRKLAKQVTTQLLDDEIFSYPYESLNRPLSSEYKNKSSPTECYIRHNTKTCFKQKPIHSTSTRLLQCGFNNSFCFNVSSLRVWDRLKLRLCRLSLMASHGDLSSVHEPVDFRKKKISGQQKREELELEVSVLHKMLVHEQKVQEYLDGLNHLRRDGSAHPIPNFLPPKVKELLMELSMVENEITRLESQISHIHAQMKNEKEFNMESKSKEWEHEILKNHHETSPLQPNRKSSDKVTFETKALHFISKAIKGDYLSDFSANGKSTKAYSNQKENFLHEEQGVFREKILKRSGLQKPPSHSPLRDQRHPTPRRDRNLDIPVDIPHKVLSSPLHPEEEHRWSPNKLSESIMKCLIFIFVRLLRTSRTIELEKSGPTARYTNFSQSFRENTSANPKTTLIFQKDSRQQDPYGIFDSEESIPRDIGPYKNLVRFTSTSMDLKCIQNSSSVPLFQKLKILMDSLQTVELRFLSHQQKLAFWINMYNACIMHAFLQHGVPSVPSPENSLTLINKASLNIAGKTINAQAIEHFILRKPANALVQEILGKDDNDKKETTVSELYGLEIPDPNITFALCCGTRSSPAVKIYTGDGVTMELERSKLEYLQAAIMVTSTKRIALPELLLRHIQDFAQDKETLMEWVCQQLPASGSLRKSIVECFRGVPGARASAIDRIPHEFEFQYLLAI